MLFAKITASLLVDWVARPHHLNRTFCCSTASQREELAIWPGERQDVRKAGSVLFKAVDTIDAVSRLQPGNCVFKHYGSHVKQLPGGWGGGRGNVLRMFFLGVCKQKINVSGRQCVIGLTPFLNRYKNNTYLRDSWYIQIATTLNQENNITHLPCESAFYSQTHSGLLVNSPQLSCRLVWTVAI